MSKYRLFSRKNVENARDAVETAIQQSKDGLLRTWDAALRKSIVDKRRKQREHPKSEHA